MNDYDTVSREQKKIFKFNYYEVPERFTLQQGANGVKFLVAFVSFPVRS